MLRIPALLLILLLVSCASDGAEPIPAASTILVCPHGYVWTPTQVQSLGEEDEKLSPDSMAHRAIAEDGKLRDQIAAVCGAPHVP